jgi:hypothetical protein
MYTLTLPILRGNPGYARFEELIPTIKSRFDSRIIMENCVQGKYYDVEDQIDPPG